MNFKILLYGLIYMYTYEFVRSFLFLKDNILERAKEEKILFTDKSMNVALFLLSVFSATLASFPFIIVVLTDNLFFWLLSLVLFFLGGLRILKADYDEKEQTKEILSYVLISTPYLFFIFF